MAWQWGLKLAPYEPITSAVKDPSCLRSFCACSRILIRVVLWLMPILCVPRLQAQDTRNEFWPEFDVYLKLNEKSRLFFLYSATKLDQRATHADGTLGGHLDFYTLPLFGRRLLLHRADAARSKSFMLRAGYLFSRTPSGSTDPFTEHTPTVETHWRFPLPGSMLLTDRNRADFRFVDGDYQPRYRNRLKLERTFKAGRLDLTPYGHAEAFYDWRFDKFHRFRYSAGAEVLLGRHVIFEGYYLRQRDSVSSPQHVNAVGLALQFYFP
jgi:Protein of unknown function (DUF2490)